MNNLLHYTILTEPDIQRVSALVMDAVQSLGGNRFATTGILLSLLPRWRDEMLARSDPLEVMLHLDKHRLLLEWREQQTSLDTLGQEAAPELISSLQSRLREQSELADPELLRKRNEAIKAALEDANERAAAVEELENMLQKKKQELRESIRQAETDSLTQLFNRGAFDIRLNEAVIRCQRQREPLCLIMLDLDYFKQINDSHGHQYGDEYLKKTAAAMLRACREGVDYPCRVGGDEFAIIIYAGLEIAERIACQLLTDLNGKASIGCAQLACNEDAEQLVARADAALYAAKNQGRGRVVVAEQQPVMRSGMTV